MRLGFHLVNYGCDRVAALPEHLRATAAAASDAGFDVFSVMDHLMPIPYMGSDDGPMLEAYTTLGFLAAATQDLALQVLVSGVTYRPIGVLAKMVSTLDTLSSGRARLGLGAGWYQAEHDAYGVEYPADRDRLDLLEDALAFLRQCQAVDQPFVGHRLRTTRSLLSPPLRADLPIMVGGSGERRTLRLAARYGDACNLFANPDLGSDTIARKVTALRTHCDDVGRDPAEVAITVLWTGPVDADLVAHAEALARHGVSEMHVMHLGVEGPEWIRRHVALWQDLRDIEATGHAR